MRKFLVFGDFFSFRGHLSLLEASAAALVFFYVIYARVSYTDSDPLGALLSARAILLDGSLRLDGLITDGGPISSWGLQKKSDHYYYYFPVGSSLLALPLILVCELIGFDSSLNDHNLQMLMAASLASCILLMMIKIARFYLPRRSALIAAITFWAGTAFSSTLGTAYWSHDVAVLFALLAIYGSLNPRVPPCSWCFIGSALMMSYLSRPTMALLLPAVILIIAQRDIWLALKTCLVILFLLVLFIFVSEIEFSQILPDYYIPSRLDGDSYWTAFYGNLISPSRGIIFFSPMIVLLPLVFSRNKGTENIVKSWWLIAVIWPLLHLLAISKFAHWYGGHCYGSRLMVDVLPGIYILYLYFFPDVMADRWRIIVAIVAIAISVWINAWQGLRNTETRVWNMRPDISKNPDHLFDWAYPQFSASFKRNLIRQAGAGQSNLK